MKTFSLAALTGALAFTSSLAFAGPRCAPDPFPGRAFVRGHIGPVAVGIVPSPLLRIAPRAFVPAPRPAYVPGPRREFVVGHVAPQPPVVRVDPTPTPSGPGSNKPPKPQGNGGSRPPRPAS